MPLVPQVTDILPDLSLLPDFEGASPVTLRSLINRVVTFELMGGGSDKTAAQNSTAIEKGRATGLPVLVKRQNSSILLDQPFMQQAYTRILGEGRGKVEFRAATDFGAGQYLFDADATNGEKKAAPVLRGFSIRGVGNRVIGSAPCQMHGIKVSRNSKLEGVEWGYFNYGAVMHGDHISITGFKGSDCLYNMAFLGNAPSFGDTYASDGDLSGSLMGSIGLIDGGCIDASEFIEIHVGYGPIGIHRIGTNPARAGISNTRLGISFESCDNNAIRDDSTGGEALTMAGVEISNPGHSRYTTYYHASLGWDYTLDLRLWKDCEVKRSTAPFKKGNLGAIRVKDAATETSVLLQLGASEVAPILSGGAGTRFMRPNGGAGVYAVAKTAITAKDAVELTGAQGYQVKTNGSDNRPYLGQALQTVILNDVVAVQTEGIAPCRLGAVATTTGGTMLKADGVNLTPAPSSGITGYAYGNAAGVPDNKPIVGASRKDYAANADAEVVLFGFPIQDRGFVAPGVVTTLPTANASRRFQLLPLAGGTGVADVTYQCLKGSNDAYSWVAVVSAP